MDITTLDGPSPSDIEKANDERYANDLNTLVEVFAVGIRADKQAIKDGRVLSAGQCYDLSRKLREVSRLLVDGISADGLYVQQCCEDHGEAMVLNALARAYKGTK